MRRISPYLKLLIGTGIFLILCSKFSLSLNSIFKCRDKWQWVAVACLIPITISPAVSVNRWKLYLKLTGINERFWPLWKINLISTFQGLLLPSTQGVDAFRMYHISERHPEGVGGASGSVLIERMIGMLIWCGIALVGLPFVLLYASSKWPIFLTVVGFALASSLASVLVVNPKLHSLYANKRPKSSFLNRVVNFLDETHGTLVSFPYRKVLWSSIALILIYQFCSISCVWLLFNAYGVSLPIYMHMAFYPVIAIIAMMPVTIGGFGVREGAFAYFYSFACVPAEIAVCVSILNYMILTLIPAMLGGIVWVLDEYFTIFRSKFLKHFTCER